MRSIISEMTKNGIKISKESVLRMNAYFVGMHGRASSRLYDLNYSDTPLVFDIGYVKNAVYSEFKSIFSKYVSKCDGSFDLTPDLLYFMYDFEDDADFKDACYALRELLLADHAIKYLKTLWGTFKIKSRSVESYKLPCSLYGGFRDDSKLQLCNDIVANIYEKPADICMLPVDKRRYMLEFLADKLGVEYSCNKPIFVEGVSVNAENMAFSSICAGRVPLTSEGGVKLMEYITDYINSSIDMDEREARGFVSFELKVRSDSFEYVDSCIKNLMNNYGFQGLFMTNDYIYLCQHGSGKSVFKLERTGSFVVNTSSQSCLPMVNQLVGINGEFVEERYVDKEKVDCAPVELIISSDFKGDSFQIKKALFYYIPYVNMLFHCMSNGFEYSNLDTYLHSRGIQSTNLEGYILSEITKMSPSDGSVLDKHKDLVSKLVFRLVQAENGVAQTDVSFNEGALDDDIFYQAMSCAEFVFRRIFEA